MKKRNMFLVGLLVLVTCGIYGLYWLMTIKKDISSKASPIPSIFLFLVLPIILGAALVLLPTIRLDDGETTTGFTTYLVVAGIISLISWFGLTIFWLYKFCSALDLKTAGKIDFDLSFILALVAGVASVPFVWFAVIQHKINGLR